MGKIGWFVFIIVTHFSDVLGSVYTVTLKGVSIAGKALQLPPNFFSSPDMLIDGVILDSGSTAISLPTKAFNGFKETVIHHETNAAKEQVKVEGERD